MIFIGIDPGLTAPAVCVMDEEGNVLSLRTIRTGKLSGQDRVGRIVNGVASVWDAGGDYLGSIEAYAYSANTQGQNAAIEAVGAIKYAFWVDDVPFTQSIGPLQLRKYITGAGDHGQKGMTRKERRDANKRAMIQAAADAGVEVIDDNQADAWGLAVILRDAYLLATRGVRPTTLYRFEVCDGLRPWIEERVRKGARIDA